jgi:molybdopterin molybdotransferase
MRAFPIRSARIERISLTQAEGRILAERVVAPEDVPAFDRSMVDGYAVRAEDVRHARRDQPVLLRLAGEVVMGQPAQCAVGPGEAVTVPTGGALPAGTTGIVKVEDTERRDDTIVVFEGRGCEDRVTPRAADVSAGQVLFEAGRVLDPAAIGLLAAAGVPDVATYRPPRVAILVTGDELVPAGRPLRPGQIRESNGVTIATAVHALGFDALAPELLPDAREVLMDALSAALATADAVIVSGGSSVGTKDYTPALVAAAGDPGVIVHGVRVKPGRPVMLGLVGEQPVIGLPGNPVSALVMFEALAKPVLLRMVGKEPADLPWRARLETEIELSADLEHRIPVQMRHTADGLWARPLLGSSSQMHILAYADGIFVVPEGSGPVAAGSWIEVLPMTKTRTLR